MPCSRESPCGGLLRVVLTGVDFLLEECLNGHSYRSGVSPFDERRPPPGRFAHLGNAEMSGICAICGEDIEPTRGRAALYCKACSTKKDDRPRPCWWCLRSIAGPCVRHGGPPSIERDRKTALAYYYKRKALATNKRNRNAARDRRRRLEGVARVTA